MIRRSVIAEDEAASILDSASCILTTEQLSRNYTKNSKSLQ